MTLRTIVRNWLLVDPINFKPEPSYHQSNIDMAQETAQKYGTGDIAVIVLKIDNGYILRVANNHGARSDVVYAADENNIAEQLVAVYARNRMLGEQERSYGAKPAGPMAGAATTGYPSPALGPTGLVSSRRNP